MKLEIKLLPGFLVALVLLHAPNAHAYSPTTTHAGLTEQIVEFYSAYYQQPLSDEDTELIVQGSIDEDMPLSRTLNHFYDPIRNMGLHNGRSSKEWAAGDWAGENRWSWPLAIEAYARGDRRAALLGLGHVLHLIEDASVPDHTRNDPHMGVGPFGLYTGASLFEDWSETNKNRATLQGQGSAYVRDGLVPVLKNSLSEYFDFIARYSNMNFFSPDTIYNELYGYTAPKVVEFDDLYGYGIDSLDSSKFKLLVAIQAAHGRKLELANKDDASVLEEYFDRLGKQAVLTGAGVVDLFFKEAEAARRQYLANPISRKPSSARLWKKIVAGYENFSNLTSMLKYGESLAFSASVFEATNAVGVVSDNADALLAAGVEYVQQVREEIADIILPEPAKSEELPSVIIPAEPIPVVVAAPAQPAPPVPAYITVPSLASLDVAAAGFSGGHVEPAPEPEQQTEQVQIPEPLITPVALAAVLQVVISEISIETPGPGEETTEFIELYNPGDSSVDLSGYSLQYLSGGASGVDKASKKNFTEGAQIAAHGFYLIGTDNYSGQADMQWASLALNNTGATVFLVSDKEFITGADDPQIIDRVSYGSGDLLLAETAAAPLPPEGQSIERKGDGEFTGNAQDTQNNEADFLIREVPKPQGVANLPEPRSAPSWSSPPASFAAYDPADPSVQFTPQIRLSWPKAFDSEGKSELVTYRVGDAVFSGVLSGVMNLIEIGREYQLELTAVDRDGLASAPARQALYVPSYFTSLTFFKEADPGPEGFRYALRASYDHYPFIRISYPHPSLGNIPGWHMAVFYYNKQPEQIMMFDDTAAGYLWGRTKIPGALKLSYADCGTAAGWSWVLPDSAAQCDTLTAGVKSLATDFGSLAALDFASFSPTILSSNFSQPPEPGVDYVTAAFYAYVPGSNANAMQLVAYDKTQYAYEGPAQE